MALSGHKPAFFSAETVEKDGKRVRKSYIPVHIQNEYSHSTIQNKYSHSTIQNRTMY
jgi:hypothetical protein